MGDATYTLQMVFETAEGKKANVNVSNSRDDLEASEVQAVMNQIISSNVFISNSGALTKPLSANVVVRVVSEII